MRRWLTNWGSMLAPWRWKARADVADRSTRPHRRATTISQWEEGLIVELSRSLALPLDDIVEAMRRCLNPKLSRSGTPCRPV